MLLRTLYLKNFRNFEDEIVNFNDSAIIIGPNDVGKSNLIYSMRLLLDKSLSQNDITPKESDFNIFSQSDVFTITIKFSNFDIIKDEKTIARFGKLRNANGELFIAYKGYRNNEEPYEIFMGDNQTIYDNPSCKIDGRVYLNCFNMVYLDSSRILNDYLKSAKNRMINRYKNKRSGQQIEDDKILMIKANENLANANSKLEKISYISESINFVSDKMHDFSYEKNDIVLSVKNDILDLERKVELVSIAQGKKLEIGGDGKSNEIYLIMWLEENIFNSLQGNIINIYAIEEPENHLYHPLQKMIGKNIKKYLDGYQLILSSHSPSIIECFNPASIIRLTNMNNYKTKIINSGCSDSLIESYYTFGFRHNIITDEMFFSNIVFLVEGVSEKLLYSAISKANGDILEKNNARIISVEGVGFLVYIKILKALSIDFIVRTDNDIVAVKYGKGRKKTKYSCSGLLRLIKIYKEFNLGTYDFNEELFSSLSEKHIPKELKKIFNEYLEELESVNLFLSGVDLEYDMFYSPLKDEIIKYYENDTSKSIIEKMREEKGNNMYNLMQNIDDSCLKKITAKIKLGKPLFRIINGGNDL